jgi:hypothetical protein
MGAAKDGAFLLYAVPDYLAAAVAARGRQRLDGTLKGIKGMRLVSHRYGERFVVVISAYLTLGQGGFCPPKGSAVYFRRAQWILFRRAIALQMPFLGLFHDGHDRSPSLLVLFRSRTTLRNGKQTICRPKCFGGMEFAQFTTLGKHSP